METRSVPKDRIFASTVYEYGKDALNCILTAHSDLVRLVQTKYDVNLSSLRTAPRHSVNVCLESRRI